MKSGLAEFPTTRTRASGELMYQQPRLVTAAQHFHTSVILEITSGSYPQTVRPDVVYTPSLSLKLSSNNLSPFFSSNHSNTRRASTFPAAEPPPHGYKRAPREHSCRFTTGMAWDPSLSSSGRFYFRSRR